MRFIQTGFYFCRLPSCWVAAVGEFSKCEGLYSFSFTHKLWLRRVFLMAEVVLFPSRKCQQKQRNVWLANSVNLCAVCDGLFDLAEYDKRWYILIIVLHCLTYKVRVCCSSLKNHSLVLRERSSFSGITRRWAHTSNTPSQQTFHTSKVAPTI